MAKQNADELLSALQAEDGGLQMIVNTMPGGVINCRNDAALTLVYMSDMFLKMIGYTRAQLKEEKENSLKALIPEEEFEPLMAEVERQLSLGDTKEIQYRLRRRDGSCIWVLDKGHLVRDIQGNQSFCCILVDITERIGAERELQLSLQRHRIILEQTNDIIFEWSRASHSLMLSPAWKRQFGPPPNVDLLFTAASNAEQERVYPDDLKAVKMFALALTPEKPASSLKMRIRDLESQFRWCQVRITAQFDAEGQVIKYLGVIRDIDDEMRSTQVLLQKAQRDSLTGLNNRETTRELIEQCMKENPDGVHAMLIIDLDDFKKINDSNGHLYGDAALRTFGSKLKSFFREEDIIGRYGGDEFLIFLPNVGSKEKAVHHSEKLLQKIQEETSGKDALSSFSAGIAVCPEQEATYDQLFREADIALYQAKQAGKNQCMLYHSADFPMLSITQEESYAIRSQKQTQTDFDLLYDSPNTKAAIQNLLEIIGRQYNVSRVYVFECSEDGRFMSNTFEWCNDGITAEIEALQNMPLENYENYFGNFDENGIFYCGDMDDLPLTQQKVLSSQGILSILQCTMSDQGKVWGFVGFDDCKTQRSWDSVQIFALNRCARIISVFLRKLRFEQKLERMEGKEPHC